MKQNNPKIQRVIVYIDGYNLYYGMRAKYENRYKWLDVQALAESFMRPGMELVRVKYFTSIIKNSPASQRRQEVYLTALESHCNKIEIYYGHFLSKDKICPACGQIQQTHEEKKTDVNIACQMLNDAHFDRYDCCYLVSGDSDLVPPIQSVKENYPDKRAIVAHPPMRKSKALCKTAHNWFSISRQKLLFSQMPKEIITRKGNTVKRPSEWL